MKKKKKLPKKKVKFPKKRKLPKKKVKLSKKRKLPKKKKEVKRRKIKLKRKQGILRERKLKSKKKIILEGKLKSKEELLQERKLIEERIREYRGKGFRPETRVGEIDSLPVVERIKKEKQEETTDGEVGEKPKIVKLEDVPDIIPAKRLAVKIKAETKSKFKTPLKPIKKPEKEIKPIKLAKQVVKKGKAKIIESYGIEIDKAKVKVEITRDESGTTYNLYVPEIGLATASLLGEVREDLVSVTTISMKEIIDPSALGNIKKKFMKEAASMLRRKLPNLDIATQEFLVGKLMQDMLGLGEIEFLVADPSLEEVVIQSSKEPIRVYHKKYGWLPTNVIIRREEDIINYSNIVARRVGRQITVLTPLLDAHLVTGDRVNAILYPISTKGNTITIRKFARDPFTIIDLINNKTCSLEIATLLWLAIEYEMNVLISGGTASGKTVLLNACMPFIPPNHRIVSVEDTRELMLPDFLYWSPLVTRTPNPEGKGEVSMLHLLINSLRMRPDRIILGEMRRKEEAMVLFEAMHTGHSVYATVHADSAAETISRLTNPPLSVPPNLLKAVNLNVVMFRDRKKGIRRILQIAEFESGKDSADANIIYRWISEGDKIIKHSESARFFEDISRNTGMSQTEMNKNLDEKKKILSTLVNKGIRDLNEFGKVMNVYYTDKEKLISAIRKNKMQEIIGRKL